MVESGNCSLVIRGNDLNLVEIEKNLKIKPTKIAKKGEIISKIIGKNLYDVWKLEIEFDENSTPSNALEKILSTIKSSKMYLQSLAKFADISIKCYIQSDYAQMNFEISSNVLKELANMDIKFEISILSWGRLDS